VKLSESIEKFKNFIDSVNEAIVVPPRKGLRGRKIFVSRFVRELSGLYSEFQEAYKIFRDGDQLDLRTVLDEVGVQIRVLYSIPQSFEKFYKNISRIGNEFLKLETDRENRYYSLWRMFGTAIADAPFTEFGGPEDKFTNEMKKFASANLEKALEKTELNWNPKYEEGIPEIVEAALKKLSSLSGKILNIWEESKKRLAAEKDAENDTKMHSFSSKVEGKEKMYHASINAKQLFEKGFSKNVPGQAGLGGPQRTSSGEPATSFTYDFDVAKEISRAFKELAMISKGEIKGKDIFDWIMRTPGAAEQMSKLTFVIPKLKSYSIFCINRSIGHIRYIESF